MKYLVLTERDDHYEGFDSDLIKERLFDSLGEAVRVARADWDDLTDKEKEHSHISVWNVYDEDVEEDGYVASRDECYAEYSTIDQGYYID